jgi:hypothetical protein
MKNPSRFFVGCSLLALFFFYGCSYQIPEAEMKAAQEAMDKAKAVYAEDLAPSNWKEAMIAWEQAQAAVKESKPAKTLFLRARARFEKAVVIASATGEDIKKEIVEMQTTIAERSAKVRTALNSGRVSTKVRNQVAPIAAEVEEGASAVESLVSEGNLLKARTRAKEVQRKVYNAELILAGKKPVS